MKLLTTIVLALVSSLALAAGGGTPGPLCPKSAPSNCVSPNWGQIIPEDTNALISVPSTASGSDAVRRTPMEARRVPVAMTSGRSMADDSAIRSVRSPQNLFQADTARLTTAIQRARFNADGSIASGGEAIAAAAERLVKQAGARYQLTLYVRVPEKLATDESEALDKKLQTLNGLLSGSARRAPGSDTRG